MSPSELTREEVILKTMKLVLTQVAKDTATEPGLKHPLSEQTIKDIRDCFVVIAHREQELAEENGRSMTKRPRFTDEPRPGDVGDVVVPISSIKPIGKRNKSS